MTGLKLTVLVLVGLGWLGMGSARSAHHAPHGFLDRIHKDAAGHEAKYVIFVPHAYDGEQAFPLIFFLHGHGESGADGKKQAKVGLGSAIRKQENTFPFIVVFPQSQKYTWKTDSEDTRRALDILAEVEKEFRVDPRRVYLTGLSMGGYGTWGLAAKYPERWAAIVPICGGGRTDSAAAIKNIPCWCFHGAADPTVPVANSRKMIAAMKEAGGAPKYTEYPGVKHNSWDKAYATKELYEWLLEQRLP
jgi:predicted peptidase